jgi:hypothetical protein
MFKKIVVEKGIGNEKRDTTFVEWEVWRRSEKRVGQSHGKRP